MAIKPNHYVVKVNDFSFQLSPEEVESADMIRKSDNSFHLINDHQGATIILTETDASGKKLSMDIDGSAFHVEIRDELEQMLDQLGFSAVSTKQIKEIKAPMPGLVLDIHVDVGQEVKEGDKMLILEAMKMENSIMTHTTAKVKAILVKKGQAVEKNQVLMEFE